MAAIENKLNPVQSEYTAGVINGPEEINDPARDTPALNFLEDGNQYVLDCVTDLDGMAEIGDDWKYLEARHGEAYIYFQSFDWCYQWCKIYTESVNPACDPAIRIFTLRRNSELIMVWPLMETHSRAGVKNLTFLSEPHGQYGNIICNRKLFTVETGKKVWAHIRENSQVDAITLDQYPKPSMLHEIIGDKGIVENSQKHSSVLQLSEFENWDEYKSSLSKNERKRRNQRNNKLARQGKVSYVVYFGSSAKYRELVELALAWKIVWLNETGRRASVLSQQTTKQFLSNLPGTEGGENLPAGAMLGALTLDGIPIGIEIGMCLDGHYYSYLGAFDWEHKKLSPGKIQIEMAQMWAKEAGLITFDFLGDPADYKTSWTDTQSILESRSFPLSVRGFIYCMFWKAHLRPLVRKLFNTMNAQNRAKLLKLPGFSKNGAQNTPTIADTSNNSSNHSMHTKQCVVDK